MPIIRPLIAALLLGAAFGAAAEKNDRTQPITVEADKPGTLDLQRQVVVFNGNVLITQGSLRIRAERVELRERPDGYRAASATGAPVRFSQKRDGVDETVEGSAERIEFDTQSNTLRLIGNAAVRRMRGSVLADEIVGSQITWDNTNELFTVTGGATTPNNPSGRVRAVFSPPGAAAASAPPASGAELKPSRTLSGAPR
jgi:lipopolysaccharide export system protein LptA